MVFKAGFTVYCFIAIGFICPYTLCYYVKTGLLLLGCILTPQDEDSVGVPVHLKNYSFVV